MRELHGNEINEATGVGAFLRRWHGIDPALSESPAAPVRSSTGNINVGATEGSSPSVLLAPQDRDFANFIEPGVAPLVHAAIARGWITYTSCEGHSYRDGSLDELHVGLLYRDANQCASIAAAWQDVGVAMAQDRRFPAVEPALAKGSVTCDGLMDVPTLDLYLCRADGADLADYLDQKDEAAALAAALLDRGEIPCA